MCRAISETMMEPTWTSFTWDESIVGLLRSMRAALLQANVDLIFEKQKRHLVTK